ncbi:MAG: KEOPS complex kinase/ATPase Bud32 [Candidatus Micrarchaeota archaeon]
MRGAEAKVSRIKIIEKEAVLKSRIPKNYRVRELDRKLRIERTRSEAKLLNKAKLAGVNCPTVLEVNEFEITMSFVEGARPKMNKEEAVEAGVILARLHQADIIHGDYTPANLIKKGGSKGTVGSFYVIDFGLGFVSGDVEDKAVDVFTMLKTIKEKDAFLEGYTNYSNAKEVLVRVKNIEKRVRYAI